MRSNYFTSGVHGSAGERKGALMSLLLFCSTEQRLRPFFSTSSRPGNNQATGCGTAERNAQCWSAREGINRPPPPLPPGKMSIDQASGLNRRPRSPIQRRARCNSELRPILQFFNSTACSRSYLSHEWWFSSAADGPLAGISRNGAVPPSKFKLLKRRRHDFSECRHRLFPTHGTSDPIKNAITSMLATSQLSCVRTEQQNYSEHVTFTSALARFI